MILNITEQARTNMSGQGMDSHVDFNFHRTNGLHRRLNLIVYLNEVWDKEWGGSIETHSDPWDFRNDKYKSYPLCLIIVYYLKQMNIHGMDLSL